MAANRENCRYVVLNVLLGRLRSYFHVRMRRDWHFRRLMETSPAMRWLDAKPGERILDIGCGDGTYDYRINRRGAQVVGFDIARYKLRTAVKHHARGGTIYLDANAEKMPIRSRSCDAVVSFCVFEHLENDSAVFTEAHRILRDGGRLLLTLDSMSNPEVSSVHRDRLKVEHGVSQFYTVPEISAKMTAGGFRLTRSRYLMGSPLDFKLIRLSYATETMNKVSAALVRTFLVSAGRLASMIAGRGKTPNTGWTLMVEGIRS